MNPNPFSALSRSRKFWLLIMDTAISMALFFGAKYLTPIAFDDVRFLIASIQPVFVVLIGAIAYEDGKAGRE